MLSTIDNPYNPHVDYDKWLNWDQTNQYFTSEYIARIAQVDSLMDDAEIDAITDEAILEILENDMLDIYILVAP